MPSERYETIFMRVKMKSPLYSFTFTAIVGAVNVCRTYTCIVENVADLRDALVHRSTWVVGLTDSL